ncbi:MAG TPA: hypothetical protein VGO68_03790 [Pyrinomonadaceae bacterium]|jgi:hypothetical protein|nr:hypothetical protein [Pyrinomonadaceae bacterium]
MAFAFNLNLSVSSTFGGKAKMSRWAQQAFEKIAGQEAEQKRKEDFEGQRRSQILAGAPHFWNELKDRLRDEGQALNKLRSGHLLVEDIPGLQTTNLFIKSNKGKMEVKFDASAPVITFSIKPQGVDSGFTFNDLDGSMQFEPTIGSGVSAKDGEGVCYGSQDAAEYLLNMML